MKPCKFASQGNIPISLLHSRAFIWYSGVEVPRGQENTPSFKLQTMKYINYALRLGDLEALDESDDNWSNDYNLIIFIINTSNSREKIVQQQKVINALSKVNIKKHR